MKMYLMASFSISEGYYTRSSTLLFQGLIQGNGTASPDFILITIMLIWALYTSNLVPQSTSLISRIMY